MSRGGRTQRRAWLFGAPPALASLVAACSTGGNATSSPATAAPTRAAGPTVASASPTAARPELVHVFSSSSPHITEIDVATNKITRTKDVPNLGIWATNDDNCYWDGKYAWLAARQPSNDDVEVMLLDLDTLEPARRIPLGKDKTTVYVGKGSKLGQVIMSKHASGQIVIVDAKTYQVLETKDVPVNGGVACDMDVITCTDGVERAFIPTDTGDTTVAINTATRQVVGTFEHPKGIRPYMLTASPDGKYVWVQERGSDGQIVLDTVNLKPVKQVPTGKSAFLNTFSPDGKLSYVGHNADTRAVVVDANTFATVKEIEVGTNAKGIGVLPSGRAIYVIATRENFVAAVNTSNWQITQKIQLAEAPEFVYVRPNAPR